MPSGIFCAKDVQPVIAKAVIGYAGTVGRLMLVRAVHNWIEKSPLIMAVCEKSISVRAGQV